MTPNLTVPKEPDDRQRIAELTSVFNSQTQQPEFCHLFSKSLPRAGHHYLVAILEKLYGTAFQYCEFYQPSETECCKRQPCSKYCNEERICDGTRHVSMQKSHDFLLNDPINKPTDWLKYVIMVREFKSAMTSEVKLFLIGFFLEFLASHRIDSRKIFLYHDKKLYRQALALIDNEELIPPPQTIESLLYQRFWYHMNFRRKWTEFAKQNPHGSILIDFHELLGDQRKTIFENLVSMIGITTEMSVHDALLSVPIMTNSEREAENSLIASRLVDANRHLIEHYDSLLKNHLPIPRGWPWI